MEELGVLKKRADRATFTDSAASIPGEGAAVAPEKGSSIKSGEGTTSRLPVNEQWIYRTHPAFREDRRREFLARLARPFWWSSLATQLVVFLILLALWPIPILNPIKLLVVLFHETSHVLAAWLTGGEVYGLALNSAGAGLTLGAGGNEVLIVAAGYLGSLLFGVILYALCGVWEPRDVWGVLALICCLAPWFRFLNEFTALFCVGTIVVMVLGFFLLTSDTKKFFIRVIATTCCLYPLIDVMSEYTHQHVTWGHAVASDVSQLAMLTGISEGTLTATWLLLGLTAVMSLVLWSSEKDAARQAKLSLFHHRREKHRREYWKYDPNDPSTIPHYTIQ
jgi:hypothetical protein